MNAASEQTDWGFLLKWVGITTMTMIAGIALAFTSMWSVGEALGMDGGATFPAVVAGALFGGLVGLGLGGGQAIALGGRWVSLTRWVLLSVIGGAVVTALTFGIVFTIMDPDTMPEFLPPLIIGTALGLGIGGGQWLVLRGKVPNAAAWIAISIVSLIAGAWIALSMDGEGREFLTFGLMALIAASITGLGAAYLFKGSQPSVSAPITLLIAAGVFLTVLVACGSTTGGTAEASVRFAEPRDGSSVEAPVRVVMTAENFTVEPAGDGMVHGGSGHLHIMVDTPCIAAGQTIPKDETHLHFGDGSTETELALSPGTHTLCLQAADGAHTALPGDGMTHEITVTVP